MYLVSLCTLVAFGGLFGQKTENLIVNLAHSILDFFVLKNILLNN